MFAIIPYRSPSYTLAKSKKLNGSKEAPLADPEPTSDISNQTAHHHPLVATTSTANNGPPIGSHHRPEPLSDLSKPLSSKALQSVASDSLSSSPLTLNAPCDLLAATISDAAAASPRLPQLPISLQSLVGAPSKSRRTARDRKIVLYILAADDAHCPEKAILRQVHHELAATFASRGYEVQLCDAHERTSSWLDIDQWSSDGPLEARGGHHRAAPCLAEIARYSSTAYVIPVLLLGGTLGGPLLPLTVESQDFRTVVEGAQNAMDRQMLEEWYMLDEKTQPQCYRLQSGSSIGSVSADKYFLVQSA